MGYIYLFKILMTPIDRNPKPINLNPNQGVDEHWRQGAMFRKGEGANWPVIAMRRRRAQHGEVLYTRRQPG